MKYTFQIRNDGRSTLLRGGNKDYNCLESKTDSLQTSQISQELSLLDAEDECAVE